MKITLKVLGFFLFVGSLSLGLEAKEGFPSLGVGASVGYEDSELGQLDLEGPAGAIRLFQMVPSYPFTFIALDLKLAKLSSLDVKAKRTSASLVTGVMIPVDLFGLELKNVPEGAGPPVYIGYNFKDDLEIEGNSFNNATGSGWKAGFQLPLGPYAVMQFEYSKTEYSDSIHPELQKKTSLEGWTYYIQAPIAITKFN